METQELNDDQWLRNMRSFYISRSPEKMDQLDQAVDGLEESHGSLAAYRRLDRLLHNLIGSGGSYGLPEVSEAARQMLSRLKVAREAHDLFAPALASDLRAGIARLTHLFGRAATE